MNITDRVPYDEGLAFLGADCAASYKAHRNRHFVYYPDGDQGFDRLDHVSPNGWGPGAKIMLSVQAIEQVAVAVRLREYGVTVGHAYMIGAHFAFRSMTEVDSAGRIVPEAPRRDPGCLFAEGRTWLSFIPGLRSTGFCRIWTDADPRYGNVAGTMQDLVSLGAVGMLDMTALCEEIAASRGLPIEFFKTGSLCDA